MWLEYENIHQPVEISTQLVPDIDISLTFWNIEKQKAQKYKSHLPSWIIKNTDDVTTQ